MDGNANFKDSRKILKQPQDSDDSLDRELSVDLERLARSYADDFDMDCPESLASDHDRGSVDSSDDNEVSLEELSRAFAEVVGATTQQSPSTEIAESRSRSGSDQSLRVVSNANSASSESGESSCTAENELLSPQSDDEQFPVTPLSIVESVLLLGRPDNGPITATEIAGLIRGVSEEDVAQLVAELNVEYLANYRAFYIASVGGGYKMQLADDLDPIRQSFLGPSRPVRLSQAAIDCMALVSYQPGIQREQLDEQLGKPSGAILNQLVRRELLEIRREKVEGQKKLVPRYYPTQRLLDLAGLDSLDDLPTAEEWVDRV